MQKDVQKYPVAELTVWNIEGIQMAWIIFMVLNTFFVFLKSARFILFFNL